MVALLPLRLVALVLLLFDCSSKQPPLNDCEKRAHSSLPFQQKQELCRNYDIDYSVGPAVCSVAAKDKLHLQYKDIYRLCNGAQSDGPVDCLITLPSNLRNSIGYQLCGQSVSALPAQCYQELSSNKFSQKGGAGGGGGGGSAGHGQDAIISFCQHLIDLAPLYCVQASMKYTKLSLAQAMGLCKNATGSGTASAHHSTDPHQTIETIIEEDPINAIAASCIQSMRSDIQPSLGVTAEMVVKFCSEINPLQFTSAIYSAQDAILYHRFAPDCYHSLTEQLHEERFISSGANSHLAGGSLSIQDRFDICRNPPNADGPVNCTIQILSNLRKKEPRLKLSNQDLKLLCRTASSNQPSECFIESFGLGNTSFRAHLCHAAENAGPAHCYRGIQPVFRTDEESRLLLCIGAMSEGPAACASEAPHYLANDEKVHLCADAPVAQSRDPIQCLQTVQSILRQFRNAPKKVLGYFQENLQTDAEWTSRGLLISMCSFSDSQHPLAAAECLRSSPSSLDHDDAVRMCTNISSTEVIQHIQLCQRLIPKSWSSEAVATLCELSESKLQVEAIVKCAIDSIRLVNLHLSPMEIAKVCSTEKAKTGEVAHCLRTVSNGIKSIPSSITSYKLTSNTIMEVCRGTETSRSDSGLCFVDVLQTLLTSQSTVHPEVPLQVCKPSESLVSGGGSGEWNYRFILRCLQSYHRKLVTAQDVQQCAQEKRIIAEIRVKHFWNEDDGSREIIAGKRFSIVFELYDQYHQLFSRSSKDGGSHSLSSEEKPLLKISINENNPQAAILWGNRLNSTHDSGLLYYHHLVISQPGRIEFRISQLNPHFFSAHYLSLLSSSQHSYHHRAEAAGGEVINSFQVTVHEDPRMINTRPCLYVFTHNFSPVESESQDYESLFPMTRLYLPSSYYLSNILCFNESLSTMRVASYLLPDGSMWIEYKLGLDSIWTGVGLPTIEMPPLQRLQVTLPTNLLPAVSSFHGKGKTKAGKESEDISGLEILTKENRKKILKIVKRGYYRASLQWHPDRWMAYDQYYQAAISAIFPLITEAYETLLQQLGVSTNGASSTADDVN